MEETELFIPAEEFEARGISVTLETKVYDLTPDDVTYYGGEVKALGDGKLGGYLVRFTTDTDPDLTGDFFDAATDYGDGSSAAVYYHHGMDTKIGKRRLGRGDLRVDDLGVWIEAQLALRDEYEKAVYEMAEAGKLGWSSGTASHLVEREQVGKAWHIKAWPLGLDASLTPTPAEPRNEAIPLKALVEQTSSDMVKLESVDSPGAEETGEVSPIVTDNPNQNLKLETPIGASEDTMELTDEIRELVASAAKQGAEEAIKALPPVKEIGVTVVTDEADQPWESAGDFFMAVKSAAYHPRDEDPRLKGVKVTGMSEGAPADGGYLIAPQYAGGIVERMYDVGNILSRVASDPVTGNSMLYNAIDESSRVSGSAWGGVTAYWLGEGSEKTASAPKFRQFELKLKKVAALAYATDELLEDTAALESWLMRTVPQVLLWEVEEAIINGNGVGKPLGILASPCLETLLRIDATEIDATDIANMWSRRFAGVNDYVWLVHPATFPQLINMVVGNYPVLMPPTLAGAAVNPFSTIYGRPVIESEHCQALGTAGDIILASLSQYQTIRKGGVQSASSIHVKFTTDETAFRFVYRIDGEPSWNADLTPLHGSADVSPFVVLGASV